MLLSDLIAKGKLSAYQRWEMTSFEENAAQKTVAANSAAAAATAAKIPPATQKELEQLKHNAQKEGFAKGFEEGHQVGLKTGQEEAQQVMQQDLNDFLNISTQFNTSLQQAEHLVAKDILDLAMDLSKAMLKSALTINPELIIPIIQQAIASLPSVQQPAQLFLHPKDATLVKNKIGAELAQTGWMIVNDNQLKQGDCRIETLRNQINTSLGARWLQLSEALGRDNSWYEVERRLPEE
jgi:flagellar assembly protein FliH